MYTIGHFSQLCRIPTKTLRFYDEIGLLKPARVEESNQYRYYSPEQVAEVFLIGDLKEMAFTLEEIKQFQKNRNARELEAALLGKLDQMEHQLEQLLYAKRLLKSKLLSLRESSDLMPFNGSYKIELKHKAPLTLALVRRQIHIKNICELFAELCQAFANTSVKAAGPMMTFYYDEEFDPEDADIEVALPIETDLPGAQIRYFPGGLHATTIYVGPFIQSEVGKAYASVYHWITEKGYTICGAPFEVYLVGPDQTDNPEKYLTEVYFPIRT